MSFPLSVIVPAYNESARIGESLRTILAYLNEQWPESELIVVDDGSTDGTREIAEEIFAAETPGRVDAYVIHVKLNKGKGHAVRSGLLAARSQIALFSDADLSTPITEAPKLVEPIRAGQYDIVFGSRSLDRSLIGVHQPWRREQGGRAFNFIVRLATGLPYWDTQCGFKAFSMGVCRPIVEGAIIDRFGFDVELLYIAHKAGLKLRECPVLWDHNEGSKVSVMRDSIRMLNEVRAIRRLGRHGYYEESIDNARRIAARRSVHVPCAHTEESHSIRPVAKILKGI